MAGLENQNNSLEENEDNKDMVSSKIDDSVIEIPQHISILELETTVDNTLNEDNCDPTNNTNSKDIANISKTMPRKKRITKVKRVNRIIKKRILRKARVAVKKEPVSEEIKPDVKKELVKQENGETNEEPLIKAEVKPEVKKEDLNKTEDKKPEIQDTANGNTLIITNNETFNFNNNKFESKDKENFEEDYPEEFKEVVEATPIESSKNRKNVVWVSNISPKTTANTLRLELSNYGKVLSAKIVTNGKDFYGYALMDSSNDARMCLENCIKKVIDGNEVTISLDVPPKKEYTSKKVLPRKRERSNDPLTLNVEKKRRVTSPRRTRQSRSRDRSISRFEVYKKNFLKQQHEKMRLFMKKERAKLDKETKDLQRAKWEVSKMKRQLNEKQKDLDEKIAREERKRRSRTRGSRSEKNYKRRSNSRQKLAVHERLGSPVKRHSSKSTRITSPRKNYRDLVPPPPPKLNDENEIIRSKADHWNYKKASKSDYGKDNDNGMDSRSKRYFPRNDLELTTKDDKGHKKYGKIVYESDLMDSGKNNWHSHGRPQHYSERPFANQNFSQYPIHNGVPYHNYTQGVEWSSKPNYPKDYHNLQTQVKPFYQEPRGFGEYDKKHHYLGGGRKF